MLYRRASIVVLIDALLFFAGFPGFFMLIFRYIRKYIFVIRKVSQEAFFFCALFEKSFEVLLRGGEVF